MAKRGIGSMKEELAKCGIGSSMKKVEMAKGGIGSMRMELPIIKIGRMKLGSQGLEVSVQGLGCGCGSMIMGTTSELEEDLTKLISHALLHGVTFLDISDFYHFHTNELLLATALKQVRRMGDKVELATKLGVGLFDGTEKVHGDPAHVRACCEASLKRLDINCIDLYFYRIDTRVPIEITMGELKKLVEEGKIKYIGLSEASPATIRRAHAVHPITAIQLEWSLWTRDVEEEIVPTCRELGIGIVAYSPLARGVFSSVPEMPEGLAKGILQDHRRNLLRALPEHPENNKPLFERVKEMASKKGCTPSQLALAWVHHQGNDVCPIPDTTLLENSIQNGINSWTSVGGKFIQNIEALSVKLTPEDMAELESIALANAVEADRFGSSVSTYIDTPPLSSWKAE